MVRKMDAKKFRKSDNVEDHRSDTPDPLAILTPAPLVLQPGIGQASVGAVGAQPAAQPQSVPSGGTAVAAALGVDVPSTDPNSYGPPTTGVRRAPLQERLLRQAGQ